MNVRVWDLPPIAMPSTDTPQTLASSRTAGAVAMVAATLGVALRVLEFSRDRPLWLDEAMLALNIGARSLADLARPLDYDQTAPALYLWLERVAIRVLGTNEHALRLVPFLASVLLLPLVWIVARRVMRASGAAVATAMAAVSVTLVTFAAEAKQYGSDPIATLVAVWLALRVRDEPSSGRRWVALAGGGAACLLLSQPAVFTLGAIVAGLALPGSRRARSDRSWALLGTAVLWAVVFAVGYLALYRETAASPYMHDFWAGTFLDPRAGDFAGRLRMFAVAAFVAPVAPASAAWLAPLLALTWIAGALTLARRDLLAAALVAGPVLAGFAASVSGLYPVMDRLYLFAAPLTILAYASLIDVAIEAMRTARQRQRVVLATALLVVAFGAPAHVDRISHPVYKGVGKQIVVDVDSMAQGEPVYVAARSLPLWLFYTTDWSAPDLERLRWAASIAGAGKAAHNNAPSRGRVSRAEATGLSRGYRGRIEIVGLPTGRQFVTSTRTADPTVRPEALATPAHVDSGWAAVEVDRMDAVARPRLWVFGSHMFALDGAEPELVAELQRRGVRLESMRRQGSTVAYHVEFPPGP